MLTNLIQKVKALFTSRKRQIFGILAMILVGAVSFGLGKLSTLWQKKEPIQIEYKRREQAPAPTGIVEAAQTTGPVTSAAPPAAPPPAPPPHSAAPSRPAASKPLGNFVASKKGTAYHFPWCPGAKRIKEKNKIWFQTKAAAEKAGYRPAANCPGL